MKLNKLSKIALVFLWIVVLISINQYTQVSNKLNRNLDKIESEFIHEIRTANYWDLTGFPIDIDDTNPDFNWSKTASENDWCSGSGTWNDPYVLENITINGQGSGNCIQIRNSNVYFIIRNSTIYNSTDYGVLLVNTSNGIIKNCQITDNDYGILLDENSTNNTIIKNYIHVNLHHGIWILDSPNNTVEDNLLYDNADYGISVSYSNSTIIQNNNVSYNDYMYGISINYSNETIIQNNTIHNNEGGTGIFMSNSIQNKVISNHITNHILYGIYLVSSENINLTKNIIGNNSRGIRINSTCLNINVFYNLFINNLIEDVENDYAGANFNTTEIGNYWSAYDGPDDDDDGIIDSPYIIFVSGQDFLPIKGDPRIVPSQIHIDDTSTSGHSWAWTSTRMWCKGSGTYQDPYILENLELDGQNIANSMTIGNSSVFFIIQNSKFYSSGIGSNYAGIVLSNTNNSLIINNNCSWNNGNGILIQNSYNNTILENVANNNSANGIYLYYSDNNSIINNQKSFNGNGISGVFLEYSNENNVSYNTAHYNYYGICVNNSIDNFIEDNNLFGNIINYYFFNEPSPQYFWVFTSLHIDDFGFSGNGTWAWAQAQPWCTGTGSWNDPFILENMTINGDDSESCLFIGNSSVYFIIRNSTFYNSVNAGIRLFNTNNSIITNVNSSNNLGSGLMLSNGCTNNTISNSTFSNNHDDGIKLIESSNNTIAENNVNLNNNNGISLQESHNNTIKDNLNTINQNLNSGIYLNCSHNNTIHNNVINANEYGIYLDHSNGTIISNNTLIDNIQGIKSVESYFTQITSDNIIKDYDPGDNGGDGDEEREIPKDYTLILIIILIIIIGGLLGFAVIKTKTSKKIKQKTEAKEPLEIKAEAKPKVQELTPVVAPKKLLKKRELEENVPLTDTEKQEIEKTESEVGVDKQQFICIVHKGPIIGANYLCPHCQTFYCVKCAMVLKEKGEKCWSCEKDIEL